MNKFKKEDIGKKIIDKDFPAHISIWTIINIEEKSIKLRSGSHFRTVEYNDIIEIEKIYKQL